MRALVILAFPACALLVAPAAAQTGATAHVGARVETVAFALTPAIASRWVKEWRARGVSRAGSWNHRDLGGPVGQRRIESELWTVTLAEQCDSASERRGGVLLTVTFLRN